MSERGFPYADMHDHVRWFVETFGRERVIWGSDYPNVSDVAAGGTIVLVAIAVYAGAKLAARAAGELITQLRRFESARSTKDEVD